ncbi:hypothetical protein V1460_20805 [Streptomyces sp. SCSIO 30461]|uniref:hypothetical protein n=1 Tax=Streptomyces sp. SCSIO 30461 TaxID=3118085 RepID=UPI0030CB36D3
MPGTAGHGREAEETDLCRPQCRFLAADPNNFQLADKPANGLIPEQSAEFDDLTAR